MNSFIRKFYYGDIPEDNAGADELKNSQVPPLGGGGGFPLWEVFIRSKQGLDHKHVGSLHATDAQMAIENARDVYTRRMEGISIWVVESKHITASNPEEACPRCKAPVGRMPERTRCLEGAKACAAVMEDGG